MLFLEALQQGHAIQHIHLALAFPQHGRPGNMKKIVGLKNNIPTGFWWESNYNLSHLGSRKFDKLSFFLSLLLHILKKQTNPSGLIVESGNEI